ncbi:MAG: hypothetical protein ABI877_10830, partial [Gemmatimonadaceae bacterium]
MPSPALSVPTPVRSTWRRSVSALLLILSAGALQRSATTRWGGVTDRAGSRIEVLPIGITRTAPDGQREICRWWPVSGEVSLCRLAEGTDAARAFGRLRMGYPLLQVGFWAAMIALFLVVLRVPRRRSVRTVSALIAGACALAAILCVLAAPDALAILAG